MEERAGGECKVWLLRLFAVSWGILFGLAAYLLTQSLSGTMLWIWPLGIAVACGIGFCFPALLRRPYRLVEQLLAPVGQLFSLVALGIVFFGVFTPYAIMQRLCGRDPLRLQRKNQGASAWRDRPKAAESTDYHWQY